MRLVAVSLGLVVSCATPNPAFFATQAGTEGGTASASGQTGSAATDDSTDGATTRAPATTGHTSVTTEPAYPGTATAMTATSTGPGTDATSTAQTSTDGTSTDGTTTTGPDTASTDSTGNFMQPVDLGMMNACPNHIAPDLALAIQHVPPPQDCNFPSFAFPALVTGEADADSIQLRQCKVFSECVAGKLDCAAEQTLTVHINGPLDLVPKFNPGACVYLQYHGDGLLDASTCSARLLRLARVEPALAPVSVFVAGAGVPDTFVLPDPWNAWLEFSLKAASVEPCGLGPDPVCGQIAGDHDYVINLAGVEVTVPPMSSKTGLIPVFDPMNNKVKNLAGVFYNLRSWAHPADHCEFKWIWLADDHHSP